MSTGGGKPPLDQQVEAKSTRIDCEQVLGLVNGYRGLEMRQFGRFAVLSVLLTCVGCTQTAVIKVQVEGLKIPREYPAFVEVSNWNGGVQIVASDRITEPEVRAQTRALTRVKGRNTDALRKLGTVRAVSSEDGGKRLLKVTGGIEGNDPTVALDLQIRMPRAAGIRVINSGGEVEVVGAGGPVFVENGTPGRPGGDIQFRSGIPITEAVTLTTTEGKVLYQIGPGSTGDLDLQTVQGTPEVESTAGTIDGIRFTALRWRGTLEKGANPVRIRSDKGDIRVLVMKDAGTYGREYWDGWPAWPTSPRWVGKLAGD